VSHAIGDFELHGFGSLGVGFAIGPATADPRPLLLLGVGAEWSPASWFALALDVQSHFGDRRTVADPNAFLPFDYLAPALALRFRPTQNFGAELGVAMQLLGPRAFSLSPSLRTQTVLGLRFNYRF
jgi:hypothetical protein